MAPTTAESMAEATPTKKDKTKKRTKSKAATNGDVAAEETEEAGQKPKKQKKQKEEKKKKKRRHGETEREDASQISKKMKSLKVEDGDEEILPEAEPDPEPDPEPQTEVANDDAPGPLQPSDTPERGPRYPIFKRTTSEFVAIAPAGFRHPLEYAETNYLKKRLNNFVPRLKGVLVSYKNARLGAGPEEGAEDEDEPIDATVLGEYAPGFAWLSYEASLFMPRRHAWMEGVVILEDKEHIGIQCWRVFNAFVAARRIPREWTWDSEPLEEAPLETTENLENMYFDESDARDANLEQWDPDSHSFQPAAHGTGHWKDGNGKPIRGRLIRFRIRTFQAHPGSENRSYLSIEGTLLSLEDEAKTTQEDLEVLQYESREQQMSKWGTTELGTRAPPKGILKRSQEP